jgi:hypothetical protein
VIEYSQVGQDIFALQICNHKSYVEIGAADPIKQNNTFLLEKQGWTGISLELNTDFKADWNNIRSNSCYYTDAVNYRYNLKDRIGYLSCDINPPELTLQALKNVIDQGIVFDCITFEHDDYWREEKGFSETCNAAKEYLDSKGYRVAVNNVFAIRRRKFWTGECHFETWYVNKDIEFKTVEYRDWVKTQISMI